MSELELVSIGERRFPPGQDSMVDLNHHTHLHTKASGSTFSAIPRIIHQTWKNQEVPTRWQACQKSWHHYNPTWEYRLWTDSDNRQLIVDHHAWFLPTYDAFPRNIQRVDAAKYFILYTFGGVYADLDCECLQPIDPLVAAGGAVFGRSADRVVECAFIASSPGHSIWPRVFVGMQHPMPMARFLHALPKFISVAGFDAAHVLFHTGPQMVRVVLRRYLADLKREPANVAGDGIIELDPVHLSQRSWWRRHEVDGDEQSDCSYVKHHYSNSWLEPTEARFVDKFTARTLWFGVSAFALLAILAATLTGTTT